MDDKIRWCMEQKRGIRFVEPSEDIAREYIKSAEETLAVLKSIAGSKSNMWIATAKYYCEYFAVYALLMRVGIKSEIHDCTIAVARVLEKLGFLPKGSAKNLERDRELRIENQYYLKNKNIKLNYDELRDLILFVKNRIERMTDYDIAVIREAITTKNF